MPVREVIPLGAPLRVDLTITNHSGGGRPVPDRFGFREGSVYGRVIDPSGTSRAFTRSIIAWTGKSCHRSPLGPRARIP